MALNQNLNNITSGLGFGDNSGQLSQTNLNTGCPLSCPCTLEYSKPKAVKNMYKKLYEFYKNGQLVDVTLHTDHGGSYPVHRIVLCGESEYFRLLFTSGVGNPTPKNIKLHQVSNEALETAIHFMYTFSVCLNRDNAVQVLIMADYFGIFSLKDVCSDFIATNMNAKNVIGIYEFAKEFMCKDLISKAHKYIMKNFTEISQLSDEILELPIDKVAEIFGDDELNVKHEEIVWIAMLRWIGHKPVERKNDIVALLKKVRTGLMDINYFVKNIKHHPLIVANELTRPVIIQTVQFLYDLEKQDFFEPPPEMPYPGLGKPRLPHEVIFCCSGWNRGEPEPCNSIEVYDIRPRTYHGCSTIGHEIILLGGFDGQDHLCTVRGFNLVTQKWRNRAPMSSIRCYPAVAKFANQIYVFGGYNGIHRVNTCERYDPEINQWSPICPMNDIRSDASATTYNEKIYIFGGYNGVNILNCAEMYDPTTNQWTYITSMNFARSALSCASYFGNIYVLGGFNGLNRLHIGEVYNPATNSWFSIPNMISRRSNFACAVADDVLFVIGGYDGDFKINFVECYDARISAWYEVTEIDEGRSSLTAVVLQDTDLPNLEEYLYENREFSMDERRDLYAYIESSDEEDEGDDEYEETSDD